MKLMYFIKKQNLFNFCSALFFFLSFAAVCNGSINEDIGVNTKAMSLGNSVTAYPMGVMSAHFNPAGLIHVKGKTSTFGITYPVVNIDYKFLPSSTDTTWNFVDDLDGVNSSSNGTAMYVPVYENASMLFIPNAGVAVRAPGSRWAFGYATYSPYSMGITNDSNAPTKYGAKMLYNQRWVYAGPSVAYKVSNTFSLGVSVGLGQGARGLDLTYRTTDFGDEYYDTAFDLVNYVPYFIADQAFAVDKFIRDLFDQFETMFDLHDPSYAELADIKMDNMRDNLTTSFNIGMLWEPADWFSFGICYRSKSEANFEGDFSIKYTDAFKDKINYFATQQPASGWLNLPVVPVDSQHGIVTQDWTWPETVQFGIMLKPKEKLKLMLDLHWANWSRVSDETFEFDQDLQLLQTITFFGYQRYPDKMIFRRDWKDTWNISMGLEYDVADFFSVRFGYEERESSVKKNNFDLMWPVQDCKVYSCGTGIGINDKTSLDLGFSYMISDDIHIKNNTSSMFNNLFPAQFAYSPYGGQDYKQDTEIYLFSVNINYFW